MEEADRALADMNAKIKELEAREPQVGGAEKDKTVGKLSALRTQSSLYTLEIASVKGAGGHRPRFGKSRRRC
jgi:hypothetical protein